MTHTHRMTPLPAQYDQAATEKKWQQHWLAKRTYAWDPSVARADSYVIDTPPPTVSGTLHMGHVFSYTQADFIARFQRMNGKNVFYPMGFDDNGLPTERLVEKTKKIRAVDMSREAFIAECLSVSEEARAEFRAMFRSIALSVDWDQEYHTISDASRRLSQLSFLDLVNKGHVYRKQQPMLWDPVDQTAIAQAEVEDKELPSNFCDIAFTCAETGEQLIIGTTRPELIPACVALFYHPDDARYQHLKGKRATVPLCGFNVAILEDDAVEPEKGTGLMMCCTFGDEKDIEKWRKHNLPTHVIINKFGKITFPDADGRLLSHPDQNGVMHILEGKALDLAEKLQGKKVSNSDPKHLGARQIILIELENAGLLKEKKTITHAVKCAERSGAPLELIPTEQWFVQVTDKKDALKKKAKECNWNPDWMRIRIEQWIDGLNWDWCISRQRYFGVPFPVWYEVEAAGSLSEHKKANATMIYPKADQLPVNPLADLPAGYTRHEPISPLESTLADWTTCVRPDGKIVWLKGDADVMDTWATSSISPQLSAHGITAETTAESTRYNSLFPADLRPQAHEIIRTWAFYTLVKSHLHSDCIPWNNLMISGWCLAEDKSKMSKSKGNVVTPTALIEEKGTDAVRYWAGTSRLGQDTAFSPDLLKIGKKLVGKLWNATQFAAIHLNKLEAAPSTAKADMESGIINEVMDRWILSRLAQTIQTSTAAFTRYEYADALDATNSFFWADFCDNYLELIKKRVYNEDGSASSAAQQSAVRTLYYVLDGILKLYAPFVPHVTEELYSHIFADSYEQHGSLHARATWPNQQHYAIDESALEHGAQAVAVLGLIRTEKSSSNRSIKFPIDILRISPMRDAEKWMVDVAGAGNVRTWEVSAHLAPDQAEIVFANEADAA